MLAALEKYFDHYIIFARFMPAFLTILPLVISIMAWCPNCKTFAGSVITLSISFGVMSLLSLLISYRGNQSQEKLVSQWGGMPSTILLRHSDMTIDKYTKDRLHRWLESRISNFTLPNADQETSDPANADDMYKSATDFLRKFTCNKSNHPIVYRDNVAYGFARNLYAIRWFGVTVSALVIGINARFLLRTFGSSTSSPASELTLATGVSALVIASCLLLVFIFIVDNKFVRARGVRYAKSLFETCSAG